MLLPCPSAPSRASGVDTMVNMLIEECRRLNAENSELRKQLEVLRPVERIIQRNEQSQQRLTEMGRQLIAEQLKPAEVQRSIQRNLDETSCHLSLSVIKEFDKTPQQPWLLEHVLSAIEEMRTVIHKVSLNHK